MLQDHCIVPTELVLRIGAQVTEHAALAQPMSQEQKHRPQMAVSPFQEEQEICTSGELVLRIGAQVRKHTRTHQSPCHKNINPDGTRPVLDQKAGTRGSLRIGAQVTKYGVRDETRVMKHAACDETSVTEAQALDEARGP